jgi:hypothetical protein
MENEELIQKLINYAVRAHLYGISKYDEGIFKTSLPRIYKDDEYIGIMKRARDCMIDMKRSISEGKKQDNLMSELHDIFSLYKHSILFSSNFMQFDSDLHFYLHYAEDALSRQLDKIEMHRKINGISES